MAEDLLVEIDGGVALVVMNRPPHNFLNFKQVHQLADAFEELDANTKVHAAVLTAEGRSFCAGADFAGGGVGGGDDEVVGGDATRALYAGAGRLFDVSIPIVGAIQGPAIGGGLGLSMVPDVRVTCPEARFAANFAALGIHPGFGLSITLPMVLGHTVAAQVLYGAKRYKGEEAVEIGLASECVPADRLRDRALEMAGEFAVNAPLALRSIKSTIRLGLGDRVREITEREADEQERLSATNDSREGIKSVAERRPGNFTGT